MLNLRRISPSDAKEELNSFYEAFGIDSLEKICKLILSNISMSTYVNDTFSFEIIISLNNYLGKRCKTIEEKNRAFDEIKAIAVSCNDPVKLEKIINAKQELLINFFEESISNIGSVCIAS